MADFGMKRNDLSPVILGTLKDENGDVVNLTGATVKFHMANSRTDELKIDADAIIVDDENGIVKYEWQEGDTDGAGIFKAEWEVIYADGKNETYPNKGYLIIGIDEDLA